MNEIDLTLASRIKERAQQLGYSNDRLGLERAKVLSDSALVALLDRRYSARCRSAERRAQREWQTRQADQARARQHERQVEEQVERQRERDSLPLERRFARLLGDLAQEGAIANDPLRSGGYQTKLHRGKAQSAPPPGTGASGVPAVGHAFTARALTLIRTGEREVDQALGRIPRHPDKGAERDARIIREYEGEQATFVAMIEGCTEANVRRIRSENDRGGATGLPVKRAA